MDFQDFDDLNSKNFKLTNEKNTIKLLQVKMVFRNRLSIIAILVPILHKGIIYLT